jgi:16S rRNA (uracil1498-N3)-methyltransferase
MNRFFIPSHWLHGSDVELHDDVAYQLRNVLRMRPGARIVVLDNRGWEYEVALTEVTNNLARGTITDKRPATGEPGISLTLYQCLLKKDNFEWVLQKCTEVGVTTVVPVVSARTIVPLDSVREAKLQRWERIVTEAAEQSGRGALPTIAAPVTFEQALADAAQHDLALIPWEEEQDSTLRDVLAGFRATQPINQVASVAIIIGPEGGFESGEIALARQHAACPVTLGPRILRAETAAVAASLIVIYELDDLTSAAR